MDSIPTPKTSTSNHKPPFLVSAIMFDLDGTLINSINVYFKVVETVFEKLSLPPISREVIYAAVENGRFSWKRVLPAGFYAPADEAETIERLTRMAREIYPGIFRREVDFFDGVPKLLADINALGIRSGVVTATPGDNMAEKYRLLKKKGVLQIIETVVTNDDAPRPKPAPDTLLECCRRLAVNPRQTVYIGDTAIDIQAGKAAGSMTVGVLTGLDDHNTLAHEKPDIILEKVTDLTGLVEKTY